MVKTQPQPDLHGHVDIVSPMLVAGWVRDLADADRRLELHLIHAGAVVAVTRAEMMRPDLEQAGIGDGGYGFQFHALSPEQPLTPGPAAIRDASSGAVIPEGTIIIPEQPRTATPPEPQLQGRVEQVSARMISGWVHDQADPTARLELHLLQDGQLISAAIADEPRADLAQAGIGDGAFGFTLHDLLPDQPWKPGAASIHDARNAAVVPGGHITLPAEAGAGPVFEWPVVAATPDTPPAPAPEADAPPAPVPEPAPAPPPEPAPTAMPVEPVVAQPTAPEPTATPAPPPPPIPEDALRRLLPAEGALKVFAVELAMQAFDAPTHAPAPGPFSPADATAYYAMVRRYRPGQVIEFGAGEGTPFAQAALQANGQGRLLQVAEPMSSLTDQWLAQQVASGDMVVIHPGLGAAAALDVVQRLLPACPVGVHVHLHGLPLLTGQFGAGPEGEAAHALMQAWIGSRRLSLLFATEWHAAHNPTGLNALMRGRPAGGGGSLWLLHRPER